MILNEIYNLKQKHYSTKAGKQLMIVYIDPKTSTDDTFANKSLFPQYSMVWLPSKLGKYAPHAWGWVLYDGDNDSQIPYIKKFAQEVAKFETPKEDGSKREIDEVVSELTELKDYILKAKSESVEVKETSQTLLTKIEDYKTKLIQGLNSEETRKQLQNLLNYRREMSRHKGHTLSFFNTILMFMQRPSAKDVRSVTEWEKMGYSLKEGAKGIYLLRPSYKTIPYSKAEKERIINDFLDDKGVSDISELAPSQKYDLYSRKLKGRRDVNSGISFIAYHGYDIKDVVAGDDAETFPVNTFDWYDKDSDENERDRKLIDACIAFGESIGLTYEFATEDDLGGARGDASNVGHIRILDDKRNHGLLSTAIHETAHQLMHWTVVKNTNPRLEKFYRGGSVARGRDIVEQEAELCAWFVLGQFGYDMRQNINYLANWGLTEKNANSVFDSIAEVADYIYNGINKFGKENEKQV